MIKTPINYITGIVALGVIIFGFGLYLWIRRSITRHYRERMQLKSDEFYKKKLEENESYTQSLLKTNEYMSGVVHRDNHLMSSLSAAIDEYFASGGKTQADKALRELKALADERRELLNREQQKLRILPSTGNTVIDSALNELFIKAAAHGIDFSLTCSEPAAYLINNFLTQTELETLLCDHIKDAIIAVDEKGAKGGRVLVTMAMEGGIYEIKIFDNGVDFSPGVLGRLGIERATSRPDSGGSGIGFMTTFEALKKANACLIIQEFEQKTPFSKAVCFRFDNEHRFIVSTYRADELKAAINRDDVEIISNK